MNENIISLVVGIVVFSLGLYRRRKRMRFKRSGLRAEGLVVDILSQRGNFPIVHFTTMDGKEIQKTYEVGSRPAAFTKGEMVAVYYMPEDPQNFVLDSKKDLFVERIFMIAWVLVAGFSVYMLFFKDRMN